MRGTTCMSLYKHSCVSSPPQRCKQRCGWRLPDVGGGIELRCASDGRDQVRVQLGGEGRVFFLIYLVHFMLIMWIYLR